MIAEVDVDGSGEIGFEVRRLRAVRHRPPAARDV